MAKKSTKKRTTNTTSNFDIVKFCAFWAVVLAGVAGIVSFMLMLLGKCGVHIDWGAKVANILSMIAQIALIVAVGLAGWSYAKRNKTFKILFIVFLVLAVLGVVGIGLGL